MLAVLTKVNKVYKDTFDADTETWNSGLTNVVLFLVIVIVFTYNRYFMHHNFINLAKLVFVVVITVYN